MWKPVLLISLVILIGVSGFYIIKNWSILDCLYMTIITIFTVGFKEVRELSSTGQIFTIFVILGGVGSSIYVLPELQKL